MIETLIIAESLRTAQYVKDWNVRYGSGTKYDGHGSCPPVPPLDYSTVAIAPAANALRDLQGWRPRRVIIVNYPQWRTAPGEMVSLWHLIQQCRDHHRTEVVWW